MFSRILKKSVAFHSLATLAALTLGLTGVTTKAQAATIGFTATIGGNALSGKVYENFESIALTGLPPKSTTSQDLPSGFNIAFENGIEPDTAKAVQGALASEYAPPYISGTNDLYFGTQTLGPDTTTYISSGKTDAGKVTLSLDFASNYFGILWGSIDDYNILEFRKGGQSVLTVKGDQISVPANGDQQVNGTQYVNFTSDDGSAFYDQVVITSTQKAFEFTNVAYAVPEPASLAMCGTALLTVGGVVLRRRKTRVA